MRVATVIVVLLALALPAHAAAPPSAEAVRARGLLEIGDVDAARRCAEPLAVGVAPDALALEVLGRIARREGRTDDAVRLLEAAVAADPTSSDAHVHLGGAYVDKLRSVSLLRRLSWARKLRAAVDEAVGLDPTNCKARRALAEFYLEAPPVVGGSPERARSEAAAFRDRCQAHGYLAFALAAQTTGDLPAAEAAAVTALVADPARGEGFALLGWIERLRGVDPEAPPTGAVGSLLEAAPAWHRALHAAGRSGALPGPNIEVAEAKLRASIRRERVAASKARAHWALGLAHQIRGDSDAAWRELTAALALEPSMDLAVRGRDSLAAASEAVASPP